MGFAALNPSYESLQQRHHLRANHDHGLPEPRFERLAIGAPPFGIDAVGHHLHHDDVVVRRDPLIMPSPFRRRARLGGQSAEALAQLVAHLRVQRGVEMRAVIVGQREKYLDEVHDAS